MLRYNCTYIGALKKKRKVKRTFQTGEEDDLHFFWAQGRPIRGNTPFAGGVARPD